MAAAQADFWVRTRHWALSICCHLWCPPPHQGNCSAMKIGTVHSVLRLFSSTTVPAPTN